METRISSLGKSLMTEHFVEWQRQHFTFLKKIWGLYLADHLRNMVA